MQPSHQDSVHSARCPSCGRAFTCSAHSIANCECHRVSLTELQRQYISSRFQGCLCFECLQALQTTSIKSPEQ